MEKRDQKRIPIFQGIILALILLVLDVAYAAGPEIPTNPAEVKTWFESVITPLSDRKDTLEKDLVEAEAAVEVIKINKEGTGTFKTIQEAVDSIKIGNTKRIIISIGPGEYKERIKIERFKPYITFLGDPKDRPILTSDGTALQYGTVDSATVIVWADYFTCANIIIQNTAPRPDGKAKDAQALAIRVAGDMATFYNSRFLGFQDTLMDDKGRHFFMDCYIEGTVDFIFGAGQSLYINSEIHVIPGDPMAVITAHGRKNVDETGGYSFVHCNVTGTGGTAYLGRAWFEAARAIFSYCELSDVVHIEGWNEFSHPADQAFLAEFNNKGPGAEVKARVSYAKQLAEADAKPFLTLEYIDALKWLLPPIKEVPTGATPAAAAPGAAAVGAAPGAAPGVAPVGAAAGAAPGAAPGAAAAGAAPDAAPGAAAAGAAPGAAPGAAAAGAVPGAAAAGAAPGAAAVGAAVGAAPAGAVPGAAAAGGAPAGAIPGAAAADAAPGAKTEPPRKLVADEF